MNEDENDIGIDELLAQMPVGMPRCTISDSGDHNWVLTSGRSKMCWGCGMRKLDHWPDEPSPNAAWLPKSLAPCWRHHLLPTALLRRVTGG